MLQPLDRDLWLIQYPLRLLGTDVRRNVAVMRLADGSVVVHSTAPFAEKEIAAIRALGPVRWVLDAMLDHDTFSCEGRAAFPEAEFLAPEGFAARVGFPVVPLVPAPASWKNELEVRAIAGAPSFSEHVFFHRPSRTLIVADLLMHFPEVESTWSKLLLRAGIGPRLDPGISRRLRLSIRDKEAFRMSIDAVLQWDFARVVVGHGEPLTKNVRPGVEEAFRSAGWMD